MSHVPSASLPSWVVPGHTILRPSGARRGRCFRQILRIPNNESWLLHLFAATGQPAAFLGPAQPRSVALAHCFVKSRARTSRVVAASSDGGLDCSPAESAGNSRRRGLTSARRQCPWRDGCWIRQRLFLPHLISSKLVTLHARLPLVRQKPETCARAGCYATFSDCSQRRSWPFFDLGFSFAHPVSFTAIFSLPRRRAEQVHGARFRGSPEPSHLV